MLRSPTLLLMTCCVAAIALNSCQQSLKNKGFHSTAAADTLTGKIVPPVTLIAAKETVAVIKRTDTALAPDPAPVPDSGTVIKKADKDLRKLWPVKGPEALPGALLPDHRIVAFYGNLFSKRMGILGELPAAQMLKKLQGEIAKWQAADSTKKVIPALHLIVVTAQLLPGRDSMHRLRMPFSMIDSVLHMARPLHGIVFLDIQVGLSTVEKEVPRLEKYLAMPDVHLGIDPEFSMKEGHVPGTRIGTFDARDINYCTEYLSELVKRYNLPPKMLVVHRFTRGMVTNYQEIKLHPEVQVIMDMDGWGAQALKRATYRQYIFSEPVQYTGFKLFYKNDTLNGHVMMKPEDVLALYPQPLYIQYQ